MKMQGDEGEKSNGHFNALVYHTRHNNNNSNNIN